MSDIERLSRAWLAAKEQERVAVDTRRAIEDSLGELMGVTEMLDGTLSLNVGDMKVKAVGRINYKVNSEILTDLVREHDLQAQADILFRFKPELSVREWKNLDAEMRDIFSDAITTQAGRASFSIAVKE